MSSASDERNVTVKMYNRKIHGDYHAESAIDREIRRYHLIRNISCLVTLPLIILLCVEQYFIISEWNEIGTGWNLENKQKGCVNVAHAQVHRRKRSIFFGGGGESILTK